AVLLVPEALPADPPPQIVDAPQISPDDVAAGLAWEGHYGLWDLPPLGSCGRCSRCLHACPTDAFVGPYHLDPLRCISYWTIESRQPIPRSLRPAFGNRIFGCDICQEVCPWNRRLPERRPRLAGLQAQADRMAPPLLEGFSPETPYWLEQEAFNRRWRKSPVKRAKRAGMLRNVCVALGNWGDPSALSALQLAVNDPDPLPRGHAAWALGRLLRGGVPQAGEVLRDRMAKESAPWVREEIHHALGG
ncbi:MAG: epoxyqueuosine reductase, partial [Caldilineae bacterium]